jgi:predicted dehydrogenase
MKQKPLARREMLKTLGLASLAAPLLVPDLSAASPGKEILFQQDKEDKKPIKPVTVVVIGAGNRGWGAYSSYGLKFPEELKVVGVAEPIPYRRERISKAFGIPPENQFVTWEHVFRKPKFADALFITTPDELHYGPAMAGLNQGYDLLLEKVIAQSWEQCNDILMLAEKKKSIVAVCHVLRYTNYFRKMREIARSGQIGDIVSIQHLEPVEHIHMSHSFVRGNWANSKKSNPMILSKSCHDTDILRWIINKPCTQVSSFGSLRLFRKENAPAGSTMRCTDGCRVEKDCPYSALKIYLRNRTWLVHLNLEEVNDQTILRELKNGPYGRCVYQCDNDVVDHQVTNFEFEGNTTASFSMEALTSYAGRRTRIFGTKGDITGDEKTLTINEFATGKQEIWDAAKAAEISSGHGGGDHGLVHDFVRAVGFKDPGILSSTIQVSMASHLMGFRAEESRLKGSVEKVNM